MGIITAQGYMWTFGGILGGNRMVAFIDKEQWYKYINWCIENLNCDAWEFDDGPCRITFKDIGDRMFFALKWGV